MELDIAGIGGLVLMVYGLGLAIWEMFTDHNADTAIAGIALSCLGADFILLYLIHVNYLELGILTCTLAVCFTLPIFLTFVRGIIPHKL